MTETSRKSFASDNNAGVHPEILKAMVLANAGHALAYGEDPYTRRAVKKFKSLLGEEIEVYFVFLGTGANVLALQAGTRPFHSIICAETAHIHVDECGAPEKFTGCKLLTLPATDGKITVDGIKTHLHGIGFEHHSQPRMVSITQPTEMGTVYTTEEIRRITDFAHENGLIVHMDGARIANAAVTLNVNLRDITAETGIDILSFGGTKNGMMYGEAVVFFDLDLAENFKYLRKQSMQLASKMRFIAAQFEALLTDDLWWKNASHANAMAKLLARKAERIPGIRITQKVESNGVFAVLPPRLVPDLQRDHFFYIWNESISEVRWMTAFDTTPAEVFGFIESLKCAFGHT